MKTKADKNLKLKEQKYLYAVLKKMCDFVYVAIEKVDFNDREWYTQYEWTKATEDRFKEWLVNHLYSNTEVRNNVMARSLKNKQHIKRFVDFFVFNYGWKYIK